MDKKKTKREIWFSEFTSKVRDGKWFFCSKHFSRKAALEAAKKCQSLCLTADCSDSVKHRVRKSR